MNSLFSVIQSLLSTGGPQKAQGGYVPKVDEFGANENGRIMPSTAPQSSDFNTGVQHGMMFGSGSSSGGPASTKHMDQQIGMSALGQYQDMSRPDYSGMQQFMQLANMNKPQQVQVQRTAPNQYVQFLLNGMRGVR